MRSDADIYILTRSEPSGNIYEGYFTDPFALVEWISGHMTDDEMFAFGQLEHDLQNATDDPIRCVVYRPTGSEGNTRYTQRLYTIYCIHLDSE